MNAHSTPTEPLPTDPTIERLRKLEAQIVDHEHDGLRARWDFGRELVKHRRGGKKLPQGLLVAITNDVGVSRQDLQARMKFATRYPDEAAFSDAVRQYPSWHAMVRHGLTVKRQSPRNVTTTKRRSQRKLTTTKADKILTALAELNPEDVSDPADFGRRLVAQGERFRAAVEGRAA